MTAATLARCDYCHADVPASETFHPFHTITRCKDVGACERRQIRKFDPTLLRDEDLPAPPAAAVAPGAVCAVCGAGDPPGGLYERVPRSGQFMCRDRAACEQRGVEAQYLSAWRDSSPDQMITSADMRATVAAARPVVPPEPTPLDPARMAALAAQDRLGRKRNEGR